MQMLKKLFSSDKKFFLELDELKESEAVQTVVETTKKVASAAKETASEVVDTAQEKLESAISTEEKPTETTKTKDKSEKAKAKPAKGEAKDEAKDKPALPQAKTEQNGSAKDSEAKTPGNTGASSYDPPFWVAAMYNNDSSKEAKSNGRVAEQTFAPENLMPITTKFRRRPGGSLDKFKDMAKQAKTPRN